MKILAHLMSDVVGAFLLGLLLATLFLGAALLGGAQ